jgi:endonuclease III
MSPPKPIDWPELLDRLGRLYGRGDWRVPYLRDHAEDPFQVLIGTILSQRTRDEATDAASARLFARYPDARSLAAASPKAIEPLIRATGFYHTKARVLPACARAILDRFGGKVPDALGPLLTLPGVGPKTANCVLVFGYGLPGMPVDTHVHRIANRLGLVRTDSPEETEAALRRSVPKEYWLPINPVLVQHGQNLCRPIGPRCGDCPIVEFCATGTARLRGRRTPRPEDDPRPRRARAGPRPRHGARTHRTEPRPPARRSNGARGRRR